MYEKYIKETRNACIRNSSMMSYKLYILTATLKIILNKIKLRKENREERMSVEKDRII